MGICLSKRDGFVQQRPCDEEIISGNASFPVEPFNHEFKLQQQHSEDDDFSKSSQQPMKTHAKFDFKNDIKEEKLCDSSDYKWKGRSLSSGLHYRLRCKSQKESTAGKVVMMRAAHQEESISDGLDTRRCIWGSVPFAKSCRITTHFGTSKIPSEFKGSFIKAKSLVKRMTPRRRILCPGGGSESVDSIDTDPQIVPKDFQVVSTPQLLMLKDYKEDNAIAQYCKCTKTTSASSMTPFVGIGSSERSELEFQSTPLQGIDGQYRTSSAGTASPFSVGKRSGRVSLSFSDSSSDLFELEFLKRDLSHYFTMD